MLEILTDEKFAALPRDENGQIVSARKMWTPGFREEIPDQTPLAIPVNMQSPETLEQTMLRLIQLQKFRDAGFDAAFETEEEANDFHVEDPELVVSGLQEMTMVEDLAAESKRLDPKGGDGNVVGSNGVASDATSGGAGGLSGTPGAAGGGDGGNPPPSGSQASTGGTAT